MRIVACEPIFVRIPLRAEFRLAYQSYREIEGVVLRLETDGGHCGYGFAAPDPDVVGETARDSLASLEEVVRPLVVGQDLERLPAIEERLRELLPQRPAARAAVSIALWDALGRSLGQPVWRLWGLFREDVETSVTLGLEGLDETVRQANEWVRRGFRILKVKVGSEWEEVERLTALRKAVGPGIRLRVDCNQCLTRDSARRFLQACVRLGVEFVEQPISAEDPAGLAELSSGALPVFVDESASNLVALKKLLDLRFRGGVVLKLQKNGGLGEVRRLASYCRAAGLSLMLGCNDESRISMAASLHLALSEPSFQYWDLDGHLDLVGEPATGGLILENGRLRPTSSPGFGVEVRL
ncbi:MAG: dipeptide epimerase [candidate division KSB1 bacterium]|nr:dipeptide epimerase [candidate division KSB1 bacterium]